MNIKRLATSEGMFLAYIISYKKKGQSADQTASKCILLLIKSKQNI